MYSHDFIYLLYVYSQNLGSSLGHGVGEKRTSEGSTLVGVGVLDRRCASDATSIGPVQREERRFKGFPIMFSAGRSL